MHVVRVISRASSWGLTLLIVACHPGVTVQPSTSNRLVSSSAVPAALPKYRSPASGLLLARDDDVSHVERSVPGKAHIEFHFAELPGQEEWREVGYDV